MTLKPVVLAAEVKIRFEQLDALLQKDDVETNPDICVISIPGAKNPEEFESAARRLSFVSEPEFAPQATSR
nr:hypothetical protein [Paracoccaceae bacterium]